MFNVLILNNSKSIQFGVICDEILVNTHKNCIYKESILD